MTTRRVLGIGVLLTLLVLFLPLTLMGVGTSNAATAECQPINNQQLCIEAFSVSDDTLLTGKQGNLSITMTNPGIQNASGVLMLYHVNPANNTSVFQVDSVEVEPGTSETITQSMNASTVGTHGLRAAIVEPETQQPYDLSEIKTVEVRDEPPAELGGPIDRTEIALVALVGAILGILVLGYRQFT